MTLGSEQQKFLTVLHIVLVLSAAVRVKLSVYPFPSYSDMLVLPYAKVCCGPHKSGEEVCVCGP